MAEQENKQTVATFFERVSAGELDAAFELIGPGATWFNVATRQHGDAQDVRPVIERVFTKMLQRPIQQKILVTTAEDDRVAVVTEGKSVTTDGVDYDNMYHFLFEFAADGRIRSIWEFHDTAHAGKVLRRGREGSVGLKAD